MKEIKKVNKEMLKKVNKEMLPNLHFMIFLGVNNDNLGKCKCITLVDSMAKSVDKIRNDLLVMDYELVHLIDFIPFLKDVNYKGLELDERLRIKWCIKKEIGLSKYELYSREYMK
jgi:hypothetical protein